MVPIYDYDGQGNRTRRTEIATGEITEYDWDYRDRLIGVVTKNADGSVIQAIEYTYDVYDRRLEKSVDSDGDGPGEAEVERFIYDGEHIALVFDSNGNQTHRYLHGPQVDQVLTEELADGQVRWALADNQGTVRDVVDSDGNVLNHISYDSFGNITEQSNPTAFFRFGYTGREFDQETGQYYYRARYFDAQVGRFISEDPIDFSGGDANLYRYVFNSPANYTDPTGNTSISNPHTARELARYGIITLKNTGKGALLAGGANVAIQTAEIIDCKRHISDFSFQEVVTVGLVGGALGFAAPLAAPLLAKSPIATVLFSGLGIGFGFGDGVNELRDGNTATGLTKIGLSLTPFLDKGFRQLLRQPIGGPNKGVSGNINDPSSLNFSQTTASPNFSREGTFKGRPVNEVADNLRSGVLTPDDVPVEVITRDGQQLIVNTRSSLALR